MCESVAHWVVPSPPLLLLPLLPLLPLPPSPLVSLADAATNA